MLRLITTKHKRSIWNGTAISGPKLRENSPLILFKNAGQYSLLHYTKVGRNFLASILSFPHHISWPRKISEQCLQSSARNCPTVAQIIIKPCASVSPYAHALI